MDFKQIQIVWLGLVGGLTTFTLVTYGMLTLGDVGMGAVPQGVMPYVAAAAVLLFFAGLTLKRRLVAAIPPDADEASRLQRYFAATIVGLAVVEGGGILLIALSLVADTPLWALAGGGAALWTLVIARPRRREAGLGRPTRR